MANFTDQKPRIATESDLQARWSGGNPGERFRCHLCGYRFQVGDVWRWVYAGHKGYCNFQVCQNCDGENVLDRWVEHVEKGRELYWWM